MVLRIFVRHLKHCSSMVWSLRTVCSNKDYYSPVQCLGAKQRTAPPSLVAFYDKPRELWAASRFFVPQLAGVFDFLISLIDFSSPRTGVILRRPHDKGVMGVA